MWTLDVPKVKKALLIDASNAFAKIMHYLQEKFGVGVVFETQLKDHETVFVRPGLTKRGASARPHPILAIMAAYMGSALRAVLAREPNGDPQDQGARGA